MRNEYDRPIIIEVVKQLLMYDIILQFMQEMFPPWKTDRKLGKSVLSNVKQ